MGKYGEATGNSFRLRICLRRFFNDERRCCYISALGGLRVRWLARRLRRLFALRGPLCLLAAGHLLPPDEPLALLSPDDLVEVIPKQYTIFEDSSESDGEHSSTTIQHNGFTNKESDTHTLLVQNNVEKTTKTCPINEDKNVVSEFAAENSNTQNSDPHDMHSKDLYNVDNEVVHPMPYENLQDIGNKKLEVDEEELQNVKRRALDLLEQCSELPKRKRKRVRRRRARSATGERGPAAPGPAAAEPSPGPSATAPGPAVDAPGPAAASPGPAAASALAEAPILRNSAEQNRTARLVYSLS